MIRIGIISLFKEAIKIKVKIILNTGLEELRGLRLFLLIFSISYQSIYVNTNRSLVLNKLYIM